MLIPANAAGKVIGKGGANIANIRKVDILCLFLIWRGVIMENLSYFLLYKLNRFSHAYMFFLQISGAMIEISESKSSRGDRIAHISGTAEQKRTAENLIQAFIMAT
jgi:poly(rC)-binding protein 2/3/4